MKKTLFVLVILTIFLLSSCIISDSFTAYQRLALKAIANGSENSVKEYSMRLREMAETTEQNAVAIMISGYGHFLSKEYQQAFQDFSSSIAYEKNDASNVGIVLSLYMLNQYELLNFHIDDLNTISDDWFITVNFDKLTKKSTYEICALSNAMLKNKTVFDSIKANVPLEKIQKMEGFFFE